jgi:hypothetical protein
MWRVLTWAVVIISVMFGPEKFNLIIPETTLMQKCFWGGVFGGVSGGIMFIIGWILGMHHR